MSDLRADLAAFARKVLGRELWPHQLEAADADYGPFVLKLTSCP